MGWILRFDFGEGSSTKFKKVEIGGIFGKDVLDDTEHYNVGIDLIDDGNASVRVGGLFGLYIAISMDGQTNDNHIGQWDFDINTILGCDYGIYMSSGTSDETQNEANRFTVNYVAFCDHVVAINTAHDNAKSVSSNYFHFGHFEIHNRNGQIGFWVSGDDTFSNKFEVDGVLVRPVGGGRIVSLLNSAYDNLFELPYIDMDLIDTSGGYNIFKGTSNQNTAIPPYSIVALGRSEITGIAAPTDKMWRQGDRVWNRDPDSGGVLGWICTTSGTPGTWVPIGGDMGGIKTLADDATPTVAGGTKFLTGGTTTITDFDDGVTGQIIYIISEHAITITDATNIFLNGSGDFIMADTDTLTLICKADNKWYELARSDNT